MDLGKTERGKSMKDKYIIAICNMMKELREEQLKKIYLYVMKCYKK